MGPRKEGNLGPEYEHIADGPCELHIVNSSRIPQRVEVKIDGHELVKFISTVDKMTIRDGETVEARTNAVTVRFEVKELREELAEA